MITGHLGRCLRRKQILMLPLRAKYPRILVNPLVIHRIALEMPSVRHDHSTENKDVAAAVEQSAKESPRVVTLTTIKK